MTLLSINGLYQFDPAILDDALHIPEALDKDVCISRILLECSELEILIADPDLLKASINYWSLSQLPIWQKLYNTTQFVYNPIWNKDGTYSETRTGSKSDTETRNLAGSDVEERDLASTAETEGTSQVTAFNSSDFENADKAITEGSGTDTGTIERTRSDTGTITRGGSDSYTISRTEHGNIGVTTTQQMIREEREVDQFDMYGYIVESFKSMYCLGVY